jgi:predicted kinase
VNTDGKISTLDALGVINYLSTLYNSGSGEGEASSFVPVAGGVMASGATVIGDDLIRREAERSTVETNAVTSKSSVSVFDNPAVVDLEDVVDSLAIDAASAREADETSSIDAIFASL